METIRTYEYVGTHDITLVNYVGESLLVNFSFGGNVQRGDQRNKWFQTVSRNCEEEDEVSKGTS